MLKPIGFWTYSSSDDEYSRGRLSQLRALLASELQQKIGRTLKVNIFQDVAAIPPGAEWERQIGDALNASFFLIPIVTPALLQSEWCCQEITLFRQREQTTLHRNDLIFPLHYMSIDHLDPSRPEDFYDPQVLKLLRSRQWIDFRTLRLKNPESEDVAYKIEVMANAIFSALRLVEPKESQGEATKVLEELRQHDGGAKQVAVIHRAAELLHRPERPNANFIGSDAPSPPSTNVVPSEDDSDSTTADDRVNVPNRVSNGCGMEFVFVEAGTRALGHQAFPQDGSFLRVKRPAFYISVDPVTNRDFYQFVRDSDTPPGVPDDFLRHWSTHRPSPEIMQHPVTFVSWASAMRFCRWLGAAYPLVIGAKRLSTARLPTEAEWERAARGNSDENVYPWGNDKPSKDLLNYMFNEGGTTACGTYAENAIGVRDMAGNVGEWCLDEYEARRAITNSKSIKSLSGAYGNIHKVIKGGSWRSKPDLVRISFRDHDGSGLYAEDIGFRVIFALC